jgi:N-dimethylarginine dimethylaminohydrolase
MTDPSCYRVSWEINPWMLGNVGRVDAQLAISQWVNLRDLMKDAGAVIETVTAPSDMHDAVFPANAGFVEGNHFIVSKFAKVERAPEEAFWARAAAALGLWVVDPWDPTNFFEGAGDALADPCRGVVYVGYGQRTSENAIRVLRDHTRRDVVALRLVDPRFYHVDVVLAPLSKGHVMVYPPALDPDSYGTLRERVGEEWIVEVSEEDAAGFACNAVEVGKCLFANWFSKELYATLSGLGYLPVAVPMSEFMLAGGGCRCLVLSIDD